MKKIRLLAKIFHFITKFLAVLYLVNSAYIFVVLSLSKLLPNMASLPIRFYERTYENIAVPRFDIFIPFTEAPLFLGRDTPWGMSEIVLGIALYGVFFYLISEVFHAFRQEKIFTTQAIKALMHFAKTSFVLPPLFLIFLFVSPDYEVGNGEVSVLFLHTLLGIFALFLAEIFKEGFTLQQEQDLTI